MEAMQSEQINELAKALASAQKDLNPAVKNAQNPMLRNKYADLQSCVAACRDVLPKHGLAYAQIIQPAEADHVCVDTILMHESGQWLKSRCTLPSVGNKGVNAAQAAGSAITYARRYGLSAIVGLATDDDDDGNGAGPVQTPKQQQRSAAPAPKPAPVQQPAEPPLQDESDANAIIQPGSRQFRALFSRLNELGCKEREDYLIELSRVLGRTVESSKTLTIAEFHKFMAATDPANAMPDEPF